jgi:hypothetical protein
MNRVVSFVLFLAACGGGGGGSDPGPDPGSTPDVFDPGVLEVGFDLGPADPGVLDLAAEAPPGDPGLGDDPGPPELPVPDLAADVPVDPGVNLCAPGGSSELPGVKLEFIGASCTFTLAQAAAGLEIPYQVVVDDDVTGVVPKPQDSGQCDKPGPSGLILFEKLDGGGQQYCICDTGLCAFQEQAVTLKKGTYPGKFSWDGKNWSGPSDTGNPKGKDFPAGKYTLEVSAKGRAKVFGVNQDFTVWATIPVNLVP